MIPNGLIKDNLAVEVVRQLVKALRHLCGMGGIRIALQESGAVVEFLEGGGNGIYTLDRQLPELDVLLLLNQLLQGVESVEEASERLQPGTSSLAG